MSQKIRVILCVACGLLILSAPLLVSSPSLLSEVKWAMTEELDSQGREEPAAEEEEAEALAALEARSTRLPPARDARLQGLLDRLGVPDHPGREMLRCAVGLVWRDRSRLQNLRDRVYPDAARPLGRTGAQAERAIRHVIDAAWRTGEIDEQQRIFGDTIDARRGRPTCSEMIAQLADILRWEG